ncbi:hypothetical protein [Saccharibacillus kuerlensis]|uniref:Signal transduction histidine kinase n=1 Tax=Saccharibacillus kuerlensis TaxID=459527 RepID=A0ABQ2KV84_9BACL|nr:hypothetical protein [Saccharibacillus kuerlensis]GGN91398.1 hypothetical protein GCM10010969_03020 [Saccharibacillus kuerlensis]
MNDTTNLAILIVLTLLLGGVVVFYKDTIPQKLKRGLAIAVALMLLLTFIMTAYTLFTMGS